MMDHATESGDIAVIGMACRFPGADNYREYWQNLVAGKNSVTEIPKDRWDWRDFYGDPQKEENKTNSKWGGFIKDIDCFDPLFFGISPKEANYIDPQQRIFLETVWHAIEDAGYSPASLSGKKIGVFVGVSKNDYAELIQGAAISPFVSTGTVHSIIPNRVSYLLNFRGKSEAIDTACSSSLVALHNAIKDLRDGDCEAAIVGGVNALLSPRMFISHGKSGMLSSEGRCKVFDQSADGYVRGEGVGALFLKPILQAIKDKDNIIGVIKSTAVNHGGRGNFLTAPNVSAQAEVICDALEKADIDPRSISYIETHGTGTPLGDPIEINALKKAYRTLFEKQNIKPEKAFCGLGGVKGNIGHLESAAGMASIIKCLLAMKHKMLLPIYQLNQVNEYIDLENSPFYILTENKEWETANENNPGAPKRRSALSGFGMGGVNAHVVLEEAPVFVAPEDKGNSNRLSHLILLSAKKGRLHEYASRLVHFLRTDEGRAASVQDIAFTLAWGREPFEERLAFVVSNGAELEDNLDHFLSGQPSASLFQGTVTKKTMAPPTLSKGGNALNEFARAWVDGANTALEAELFSGRRISLPTHPFMKRKCWFEEKSQPEQVDKLPVNGQAKNPVLESIPAEANLEVGVQDSHETKSKIYSITISPSSPSVQDHVVQEEKVLPGVAYLTLLQEILNGKSPIDQHSTWHFSHVFWLSPITFAEAPVELVFTITNDGEFKISTTQGVHCQGAYSRRQKNIIKDGIASISEIQDRCPNKIQQVYLLFKANGLKYGPSFQGVESFHWGKHEAIVTVKTMPNHTASWWREPAVLDLAFQAAAALSASNESTGGMQYVPYYVESFLLHEGIATLKYIHVKQNATTGGASISFEIYLYDQAGALLGRFMRFTKRALKEKPNPVLATPVVPLQAGHQDISYYRTEWLVKQLFKGKRSITSVLIIQGDSNAKGSLFSANEWPFPVREMQLPASEPHSAEAVLPVLEQLKSEQELLSHILFCPASSGADKVNDLLTVLELVQAVMQARFKHEIKLFFISAGTEESDFPYVASVAGFARTLAFEAPKLSLDVIALDGSIQQYVTLIELELSNDNQESLHEIRYREGIRNVRVIAQMEAADLPTPPPFALKNEGVYVISGGAGGLGKIFSEHFAKTLSVKLILLGRREQNDAIGALLESINTAGSQGEYAVVDITNLADLERCLGEVRKKWGKIDGVIHAGGLIDDAFILRKKISSFQQVIAPKILGAVNLDQATAEDQLEFFLCFSSIAALMPNQGQCDYAAGNSFMDAFMAARKALVLGQKRSGLSLSVNWPLWRNGGMKVTREEEAHLFDHFGMEPLDTGEGISIFHQAIKLAAEQQISDMLAIAGIKEKIAKHLHIQERTSSKMSTTSAKEPDLPLLFDLLLFDLRTIVAQIFGVHPQAIDKDFPLRDLGMDSLSVFSITDLLNAYYTIDTKPTLMFECGTMYQIANYLVTWEKEKIQEYCIKYGHLLPMNRAHKLLDLEDSVRDKGLFQRKYDNQEFYMQDHVVEGKYNVPGACFMEMARQAASFFKPGQAIVKLTNNFWAKQLSSTGPAFVAHIQLQEKADFLTYEIYSFGEHHERTVHATGEVSLENQDALAGERLEKLNFEAIRNACTRRCSREEVYHQIHAEGLLVGPSFMPMEEIFMNAQEAIACLQLPLEVNDTWGDYLLHPTLLTGVFQTALMNNRFGGDDEKEFIPMAIESLEIKALIPRKCYVYSQLKTDQSRPDLKKFDLVVCNEAQEVVLKLKNLVLKAKSSSQQAENAEKNGARAHLSTLNLGPSVKLNPSKEGVKALMRKLLAPVMSLDPSEIEDDTELEAYGINSVMILELNKVFEAEFGAGLSKTLFFEYQTLSELTDYFWDAHPSVLAKKFPSIADEPIPESFPQVAPPPPKAPTPIILDTAHASVSAVPASLPQTSNPASQASISRDIAVIGLAGRYPQANDLNAFWRNLADGKDCVIPFPEHRLHQEREMDPQVRAFEEGNEQGGFIDDPEVFDSSFFNILPVDAAAADPQERLFLQVAYHAFENAGYPKSVLSNKQIGKVGVFVGAMWQHVQSMSVSPTPEFMAPTSLLYSIANRVSYFMNLKGPSMAIDTACSSSLTALHLACQSLILGETQMALAGGVNLSISPGKYLWLRQNNFLSSDGKCRSFGEGGDGYVPGEGVGAVVLKPLAKAIEDKDHIYGVIRSININHGGKTNGYEVPNPNAQRDLIVDALEQANLNPESIGYVEGHGTGTNLGDLIELTGLSQAYRKWTNHTQYCALGSVKSNIGHLEAASGIAELTKVLLQIHHRKLVPSLHSTVHNSNIAFEETPFKLQQQLSDWQPIEGYPRRAAISSFGAGGSNAHLIVEEYVAPVQNQASGGLKKPAYLLTLSAKTSHALTQKLDDLYAWLQEHPEEQDLSAISYTLNARRDHFSHACAMVAANVDALKTILAEALQHPLQSRWNFFYAPVEKTPEDQKAICEEAMASLSEKLSASDFTDEAAHLKQLLTLARLYVSGFSIDSNLLHRGEACKKIPMTAYPFSKESFPWPGSGAGYVSARERSLAGAVSPPERKLYPASNGSHAPAMIHLSLAEKAKLFVRQLVADQLGISWEDVDLSAGFFEHSLTSFQLLKATQIIKNKISNDFLPAVFFQCSALGDLASYLEKKYPDALQNLILETVETSPDLPFLLQDAAKRHDPFPLSNIQESFYGGRKLGLNGSVGCHIYLEIDFPEIDLYRLNEAWQCLVMHHDMLRAVFLPNGEQQVLEVTPLYAFKVLDLRSKSEFEQSQLLEKLRSKLSHKVYPADQWPLFEIRVSILPDKKRVHFSMDELIVDAYSLQMLLRQWHQLYQELDSPLPEQPLSYRDYIFAQKAKVGTPEYQADMAYWVHKLENMPSGPLLPQNLSANPGAEAGDQYTRIRLEGMLEADKWGRLKKHLEQLQILPTAFLLSVFTDTLSNWSDQKRHAVIMTFFNRLLHPDLDQIFGSLISTNIFIAEGEQETDFISLTLENQKQLLNDLGHTSVSGISVLRTLKKLRKIPASFSIPVVFTSMLGVKESDAGQDFNNEISFMVTQTPQVYLDHQVSERQDKLVFSWDVAREFYAPEVIDLVFADYCRTLRLLAEDFDLLKEKQRPRTNRNGSPELRHLPEMQYEPFPLTDQQQAYAFGRSKHGGGISPQVYLDIEVEGLDVVRLQQAWQKTMATHEMLAATIYPNATQQVINPLPEYPIKINDLSGFDGEALLNRLNRVEQEMTSRICPLGEWPFFELQVSRINQTASVIHLSVDLIIADWPSVSLIQKTLFYHYENPSALPAKNGMSFSDYVWSMKDFEHTECYKSGMDYWEQKFRNMPSGPVLSDREIAPAVKATKRMAAVFGEWAVIRAKAEKLGVSPSMILLTAFSEVLLSWATSKRFSIVIPSWERLPVHPAIDDVVGDFTAMSWLVVRQSEMPFLEKVMQNDKAVRADLAEQAVSGLKVLRGVALRNRKHAKLEFPVVFTNLSDAPEMAMPKGFVFRKSLSQTPQVHLDCIGEELNGQLHVFWDVAQGIFPTGKIEAMFEDYQKILALLAQEPHRWQESNFDLLIGAPTE